MQLFGPILHVITCAMTASTGHHESMPPGFGLTLGIIAAMQDTASAHSGRPGAIDNVYSTAIRWAVVGGAALWQAWGCQATDDGRQVARIICCACHRTYAHIKTPQQCAMPACSLGNGSPEQESQPCAAVVKQRN